MTIKSVLELQTQADSTLPDNTTQLISAADVRQMIKDFLDTMSPAYGGVSLTSLVKAVTATPSAITPFSSSIVTTVGYYTTSVANGQVIRAINSASLAGATDFVIAQGSVEGANGRLVTVELYKNGVATGFKASVTCAGATKPVSFNIAGINYTAAPNDAEYALYAYGDVDSITFTNVSILAQAQPVRSFV